MLMVGARLIKEEKRNKESVWWRENEVSKKHSSYGSARDFFLRCMKSIEGQSLISW